MCVCVCICGDCHSSVVFRAENVVVGGCLLWVAFRLDFMMKGVGLGLVLVLVLVLVNHNLGGLWGEER